MLLLDHETPKFSNSVQDCAAVEVQDLYRAEAHDSGCFHRTSCALLGCGASLFGFVPARRGLPDALWKRGRFQ